MAEFAANTVGNLATEYTSPYLSYFFRYGKIAEDFKNQRNELRLKEERVKNDVDVAEIIDKDVENWLGRVEKELRETRILEDEMDRIKFGRRAPLRGIEFITSKDFRDSESSISALKEIMEAVNAKDFKATSEEGKAEELLRSMKVCMEDKQKILIIVDDLWKEYKLETIRIPVGCKILLTTRWDLFKANAGLKDGYSSSSLIDVAKEVADECKGLPLAIVTVAKALRGESLDGWRAANQRLKDSRHLDNEHVFGEVYKLLKFSYDYLNKSNRQTTENDIQSCFLLCSLFPEDDEIPIEMLVMCGIGVGLFSKAYSIEDKRREIVVALTNLQNSGLLLEADDGGRAVRMHDVVRDFAHWLTSMGENRFMVKDGLKEWPNVGESLGSYTYTAMALWNCSCLNHFPKTVEFPKLKTLFLDGEDLGQVLGSDFEGMKALQFLFLSEVSFSLEGLQSLTNLRTLCCVNCRLENMSRLEILALIETDIDEISEDLVELSTLGSRNPFPPKLVIQVDIAARTSCDE
ncbi:hypothetical protein GQ457_09G022620 [Hibiscus cannabinus]